MGLPVMRIHSWRIRDLVNRRNKQQQTEQACDDVSEFHRALKQEKTSAFVRIEILRRVTG
jgi:hypothetical protein